MLESEGTACDRTPIQYMLPPICRHESEGGSLIRTLGTASPIGVRGKGLPGLGFANSLDAPHSLSTLRYLAEGCFFE